MKHRLLSSLAVTVVATVISSAVAQQAEAFETTARAWTDSSRPAASLPQESVSTPALVLANAEAGAVEADADSTQTARSMAARGPAIATVYRHQAGDKVAATLFVRNLPLLTYFGGTAAEADKAAADWQPGFLDPTAVLAGDVEGVSAAETDPVQRASTVAERLNQIDFSDFDATAIDTTWDAEQAAYVIKVEDEVLAVIDGQTRLADSTQNWEQDVLQATNRLRRWLGNAKPLAMRDLEIRPAARRATVAPQVAVGSPARLHQSGMASWYGPGFHGRRSASGERFNQNALTAAHRTLPFGTRVRVTNANNGRSVVVRINDRGPFTGGRVIDLSRAAASNIGMLGSGVAPVRLEVLGR